MKINKKIFKVGLLFLFIGMMTNYSIQAKEPIENDNYVKIMVYGLSCPYCAYGLEKYFKEVEGASDIFISVKDGFITFKIPSEKTPNEEELKQIIKDAGFTPGEVYFSDTPVE